MSTVTGVYRGVRGLTTAIKDAGRLREIVSVLVKHGFGAMVTRLNLHEVVGVRGLMDYTDDDAVPYSTARRIRMSIEDLGPTFVKLGQILSTRPDLVPEDVVDELQSLQDDVPVVPWDEIRAVIESELGGDVDDLFGAIETEPLASASIAQVHLATLLDGSEVVVKVQRPSIAARIDSDLHILQFLARRAELMVPELQLMDPVGIVTEFEKAIRKELDFSTERHHIGRFQINFETTERVHIPAVYDSHCSPRVLTMERMRGVKVTLAPDQLGVDPYDVAPRMLRLLFQMIFRDGFFHGDLHPGNILIAPDGDIGLIDFGLVGRLTPRQRDHVLDILIGISRQDYETVARVYYELGIKVPGVRYDYEAFEADVIDVMERHVTDKTLSEIDIGAFFGDLVAGAIRHRIKMPPNYTMVFKALMTIEGIGKTLAPEINFIEEAQPFVREVLQDRYSPRRLVKQGVDTLDSLSRFMRAVPMTATQLMQDAQRGELQFKAEVRAIDRLADAHNRSQARLARAIAFAGCVLAMALTWDVDAPRVLGMTWIAFVLLIASGLLGLPLVVAFVRNRPGSNFLDRNG